MSKFFILTFAILSFILAACSKPAEVARPTEHNMKRQEEVDQRDLIKDKMKYRESRDLPDGEQVYEEDIEIDGN